MSSHRCTGAAHNLNPIPSILAHPRGHWGEHAPAHGREPHQDPSYLSGGIPAPLSRRRLSSRNPHMYGETFCMLHTGHKRWYITSRHIEAQHVLWKCGMIILYYFICWNKSHKHTCLGSWLGQYLPNMETFGLQTHRPMVSLFVQLTDCLSLSH